MTGILLLSAIWVICDFVWSSVKHHSINTAKPKKYEKEDLEPMEIKLCKLQIQERLRKENDEYEAVRKKAEDNKRKEEETIKRLKIEIKQG